MVFNIFLILHLTGFVLFAGTVVADFVAFRQFWKQYQLGKTSAIPALYAISKFPLLMVAGLVLLILSGVGMMALTHGAFGEQIWFRIKFCLIIITILNGVLFGRRQLMRLRKDLSSNDQNAPGSIEKIKTNLRLFHFLQLALIFSILVLSIFKFD